MKYLAACLGVAALLTVGAAITGLGPFATNSRNAFQSPGTPYFRNGYEWWWHSFVAYRRSDGTPRPFFIEYFVINPGLGGTEPVLSSSGRPPSYARINVQSAVMWSRPAKVTSGQVPTPFDST